MRNSSDIFFLNDNENNAKDLWSVNGSCPMKIRRRPSTAQNDCFEYGRNSLEGTSGDLKVEKSDLKNLSGMSEPPAVQNHLDVASRPGGTTSNIECRPHKSNSQKVGDKQVAEGVSTSNMARNPITGSGMDIHAYK